VSVLEITDNSNTTEADVFFMRMALKEAQIAADNGEVPVGAVIVHNDKIVGKAHNQVELLRDATAHAEMIALTQASAALGDWRLNNAVLYVTKEPCPMCAGAMVLARIGRLVFGMSDIEHGGAVSLFNIANNQALNHRIEITPGVLEFECRTIIREFFQARRTEKQRNGKSGHEC